jgi:peptidoglycan-N-acetylglucosamine deacetylase
MTFIAPHYIKAKKTAAFNFLKKDRYLVKTPWWMKKLYPGCVWDMPVKEKTLYLSFDDGPHPTITPFVLEQLKKYNAKATFFCIGENVAKYPEVFQQVIDDGHAVGNHTFHHINGWKTDDETYLNDIKEAGQYISSKLFRPPYGRITRSQIKQLSSVHYPLSIVMWNILAGDWDQSLDPVLCFERVKKKILAGDIIVFHDSEKAWDGMSYSLPKLLEFYTSKGYSFSKIDPLIIKN